MKFIHEDFLLQTSTARRLYHGYAEAEPIFDYHCHLSPRDIAENRQFRNLFEIWLEGDHYKWRAMRANGVAERYCTGSADPLAKFQAWAATVPHTLRNPLYHWTHLELQRCFGIDELLDERSAACIWKQAGEQLARPELSAWGILSRFNVTSLCTTDDPADDLRHHRAIAASGLATRVRPTFRPDKVLAVDQPALFGEWVKRLAAAADVDIRDLDSLLAALRRRHDVFHAHGCRLSDHGLDQCYADPISDRQAAGILARALHGKAALPREHAQFGTFMMLFFGRLDAERGWVKQLHLGAQRNNNTRRLRQLGPDHGFDSIGDLPQAAALGAYLDLLDRENSLPKTIIYNSNPADNYAIAAMIGNFQDGSIPGKIQMGSGWWFLDQKEGMEWQVNALSSQGLLSRFVGMVTDSRSFMSYPRHEYFRRVLCDLLGRDVENGELPNDEGLLGQMIRNICYHNPRCYVALPEGELKSPGRKPAPVRGGSRPLAQRSQ